MNTTLLLRVAVAALLTTAGCASPIRRNLSDQGPPSSAGRMAGPLAGPMAGPIPSATAAESGEELQIEIPDDLGQDLPQFEGPAAEGWETPSDENRGESPPAAGGRASIRGQSPDTPNWDLK